MPRRANRLAHLLLCLMVALLPLRALAHGWMVSAASAKWPQAVAVAPNLAGKVMQAPCHAMAVGGQTGAEQADSDVSEAGSADGASAPIYPTEHPADHPANSPASSPATGHGCAACDLCHAGMVHSAVCTWHSQPLPSAAPGALRSRCAADQPVDGIFRPPRG